MKLSLRELHDQTIAGYLDEILSRGGALSAEAGQAFRKSKGRSFLLLPDDCGELPDSFWHGGIVSGADPVTALATIFLTEVVLHERVILIEHALARRGDPFLSEISCRVAFYQGSVYFVLDSSVASIAKIAEIISTAMTAQGFASLSVPSREVHIDESDQLSPINQLARYIDAAAVGVFDNETFLVFVPVAK